MKTLLTMESDYYCITLVTQIILITETSKVICIILMKTFLQIKGYTELLKYYSLQNK